MQIEKLTKASRPSRNRSRKDLEAQLAQHYAAAGDDEKTLEYATRAGNAAARIYANIEAEARRLHEHAREIINYIADHTPTLELRASFLHLPEVRAVIGDFSP